MFKLRKTKQTSIEKIKVALVIIKEELSIINYASRYKISAKEAREFKKWCRENYYYKSYKTPEHNKI